MLPDNLTTHVFRGEVGAHARAFGIECSTVHTIASDSLMLNIRFCISQTVYQKAIASGRTGVSYTT